MDELKIIAQRIKGLREDIGLSVAEMAKTVAISLDDYIAYENGEKDFPFTFLNACAKKMGVDLSLIMTGESAHLSSYTIDRKGQGLSIVRRSGFDYLALASRFKSKLIEPYVVTVPYQESVLNNITTSTHDGQEMDYILSGSIKIVVGAKEEILNAGDSILYNSSAPHGMVAITEPCAQFLAILVK